MTNKADSAQIVRNVKTLLLCKVEIGSENNIKELYTGWKDHTVGEKIDQYFALGDFDAFSIYDTCAHPDHTDWLAEVYNDRLQISKKAGRLYSYNPIHLVSTSKEKQQDDAKDFCAATIIYGWKDENTPIEDSITATIHSIKENSSQEQESELQFSVYQAVNICDAVILWRSDSYISLCRKTMGLLKGGFARKTYTIIGARFVVKNDNIEFCCSESEESSDVQIRGSIRDINSARTWLHKLHQANINDYGGERLLPPQSFNFLSGGFDFVEDYKKLHISTLLPHLMETNQKDRLNKEPSFWDMRTDVITEEPGGLPAGATPPAEQDPDPDGKTDSKKPITDALNVLYNRFIEKYHETLLSDKENSKTEDWPFSYGELLGVTASIDQNPALRTPAYLMFDYLRVCDTVFQRFIDGTEGYNQVLSDSLERLKKAIHSWNQLIDQTIRTDELVIKGIGFASSIYNSVPVQLVDFYNSLINNFVCTLLSDVQEAPAYAFLLLLNQSYQIRITPLFSDEKLRRKKLEEHCTKDGGPKNCNDCKTNGACWRQNCWPPEQVYLVELPTDALYKPTELIISLAHEVFHIFGDQFRDRESRWRLFGQATIQMLLRKLHIIDANTEAYSTMAQKISDYLGIGQAGFTICSPNLRETKEYFAGKLSQFLEESPIEAFDISDDKDWKYYLNTKNFVNAWETLKNDFIIKIQQQKDVGIVQEFTQFEYFLKECFADICAIRAFKIKLPEYYSALYRGISPASPPEGLHRMLQRAMITTVSCIQSFGFNDAGSGLNYNGNEMVSSYIEWATHICNKFSSTLSDENTLPLVMKRFKNALPIDDETFARLIFGEKAERAQDFFKWAYKQYEIDPDGENALEELRVKIENKEPRTKPRTRKDKGTELTLSFFMESNLESTVLEYLKMVNVEWDKELKGKKNSALSDYSIKFDNLIRNSQFFTEGFMEEIKKYHEKIDAMAKGIK